MTALSLPLPRPVPMPWPTDWVDPSARVPHPPSEAERARRRPTPMWQAVLLAGLLHLWAALLLGSVPPGSAPPGQGVWGAINLRLQAPGDRTTEAEAEPQPPLPATGPPGEAPRTRWGGAVRTQSPAATVEPGAARLGDWAPVPAFPAGPASPTMAAAAAAAAATAAPAPAPSPAPAEADAPAPGPAPADASFPAMRAVPSRLVDLPATASMADPASAFASLGSPPALADRPDSPRLQAPPEAAFRPPAPLPGLPAAAAVARPELPSLPAPAALEAPLAQLPAQPVAAPTAALAPLAGTVAMPSESLPEAASGLGELAALPAAQAPDARLSTAAHLQAPVPAVAPLASPASAAAPAAPAELPSLPPLSEAPTVSTPAPGLPDAGTRTGADIATAPSAPASAPRLNLQLPRSRGGELSRLGSAGVLAVMPRPPELKSKLASDIEKAGPPDCRTAHARMGLAAVVPLAADALKAQGGCRW